jgi:hypothetical protein
VCIARSCDRPSRQKFSVVFLGPAANPELLSEIRFAPRVCHETHQTRSNFVTMPPPPTSCSPSSPATHFQQSDYQHLTFYTYQSFTLPAACLYQKDERAQPDNLQSCKMLIIRCASHCVCPSVSSFSMSYIKATRKTTTKFSVTVAIFMTNFKTYMFVCCFTNQGPKYRSINASAWLCCIYKVRVWTTNRGPAGLDRNSSCRGKGKAHPIIGLDGPERE